MPPLVSYNDIPVVCFVWYFNCLSLYHVLLCFLILVCFMLYFAYAVCFCDHKNAVNALLTYLLTYLLSYIFVYCNADWTWHMKS